jgi:tRNA threonylcarbamoyladenosine biosynthesis protein TsaE
MSGAHRADPAQRVQQPAAWATSEVPSAVAMRDLGGLLAGVLKAGDLVVLTGDLGAGKTTLTQGIGARMMVRGDVTSPTFVIARVHPSLVGGPALVHVDAYRLDTLSEVDDLDLDASLADSVTVVEWGEGLVEGLAADRLEVRLERRRGAAGPDDAEMDGDEPRTVRLRGFGSRWADVELPLYG